MKFKKKYRIETIRAKFWDYSSPGYYFITICVKNRTPILGHVNNDEIKLSEYGKIVRNEILNIPGYHKRIVLDEWIIMPNHVHFIIELGEYDFDNGNSEIGDNFEDVETINDFYDNFNEHVESVSVEKIHEFSLHRQHVNHENEQQYALFLSLTLAAEKITEKCEYER